jgi:hypothetical protein
MARGEKRFDMRLNDRNYKVNDVCVFREYDPTTETYTGASITRFVTFIMQGAGVGAIKPLQGLHHGHCILSLSTFELPVLS